jgi:hypothetical protein
MALAAAGGVLLGGAGLAEGHPGYVLVAITWLIAIVSSTRRIREEVVYDIDVVGGGRLVWRTLSDSGVVYLADLLLVRPYPRRSSLVLIEIAGGASLCVVVRKGFMPFAAALAVAQPGMPVALSDRARTVERLPVPSAFQDRSAHRR